MSSALKSSAGAVSGPRPPAGYLRAAPSLPWPQRWHTALKGCQTPLPGAVLSWAILLRTGCFLHSLRSRRAGPRPRRFLHTCTP